MNQLLIKEAIEEARKHEGSDDKEVLENALKELNDKVQPIGAKLYEQAASEDSDESEDSHSSNDKKKKSSSKKSDDVVEGEVVDKKSKKKSSK